MNIPQQIAEELKEFRTFKSADGFTFILGYNECTGQADPHLICWNDPETEEWVPVSENQAGSYWLDLALPQDVEITEANGNIYFGSRVRFEPIGQPFIWRVTYDEAGSGGFIT